MWLGLIKEMNEASGLGVTRRHIISNIYHEEQSKISKVEVRETQYNNPKILNIFFVNKKIKRKCTAVGCPAIALC
jgi:hypothetical protein